MIYSIVSFYQNLVQLLGQKCFFGKEFTYFYMFAFQITTKNVHNQCTKIVMQANKLMLALLHWE